jgi:Ca-activated chloride channel family protein
LGLFHNTTKWFDKNPVPAAAEQVEKATRYLDENRDSGGTNLGVALEQALKLERVDRTERSRHVLVITDAQVSDAARILRLADQEAGRRDRRRISVLCIDAAPNDFLANELAERGGGVARFLTSNPDQGDITTALEEVLADWAEPVLVGLKLEVDRAGGEAAGRAVLEKDARTVIDLGDLPCGRAVWVAGRVPGAKGDTMTFRVATSRETVVTCKVRLADGDVERPALKALFGARRLLGLEYLINARYQEDMLKGQLARLGYDLQEVLPDRASSVYAENVLKYAQDALKPLLVRESLAYGLACAETAFVAVRTEAGKPVEGRVAVANALPSGWSGAFLSPPGVGMGVPRGAMLTRDASAMAAHDTSAYMSPQAASAGVDLAVAAPKPTRRKALGRRRRKGKALAEKGRPTVVFAGVPSFVNGEAVLFDSAQDARLPDQATFSRVELRFEGRAPRVENIDRELVLLIFVGDMALPRARVRLVDLVRGGGGRPLNLRKGTGKRIRIVLVDPHGGWASGAPKITLSLAT